MNGDKDECNIFKTGRNEVKNMKDSLAKLYNLTDEEKSPEGLLQSRIEEQSHLIMMLKKRADEYIIRSQTLEKEKKDLESKLTNVNDKMKSEDKKNRVLFINYNKLLQTHDETKVQFQTIKDINERMKSEITNLKEEIKLLNEQLIRCSEVGIVKDELVDYKRKTDELETHIRQLNEKHSAKISVMQQEIKTKTDVINSLNNDLKQKQNELEDVRVKCQLSQEKLENENHVALMEIRNLKKNVETQSTLIKKNKEEITELMKRNKTNEQLYNDLKEKYSKEAETFNVNTQIHKLKNELQIQESKFSELQESYDAYKVFSNRQLQSEKELTSRLRKLYT